MKKINIILLFLISSLLYSNDTIINGTGDTLHPIVSSKIKITDEKLIITYNKGWDVTVNFLFNNEDLKTTEKLAFITKNSKGDDDFISNFQTILNGNEVKFKKETKEGVLYYISDVEFRKGMNSIIHKYNIKGNIIYDPASFGFDYILLSGNNWNGPIENISIDIILPEISILKSYNSFFKLDGDMVKIKNINKKTVSLVHNGSLHFNEKNYLPVEDINLHLNSIHPYLNSQIILKDPKITMYNIFNNEFGELDLTNLDKKELRILRNTIFAWYGYSFNSADLNDFFSQFDWYNPYHSNQEIIPNNYLKIANEIKKYE